MCIGTFAKFLSGRQDILLAVGNDELHRDRPERIGEAPGCGAPMERSEREATDPALAGIYPDALRAHRNQQFAELLEDLAPLERRFKTD